jgi:hypothetical protein
LSRDRNTKNVLNDVCIEVRAGFFPTPDTLHRVNPVHTQMLDGSELNNYRSLLSLTFVTFLFMIAREREGRIGGAVSSKGNVAACHEDSTDPSWRTLGSLIVVGVCSWAAKLDSTTDEDHTLRWGFSKSQGGTTIGVRTLVKACVNR